MSGGHFDYNQYRISNIADQIEHILYNWDNEYYEYDNPDQIKQNFVTALELLNKAFIYVHRIDWLLSGDDGEDTFLKRLSEDLSKYEFRSMENRKTNQES